MHAIQQAMPTTGDVRASVVLVDLRISQWTGRKIDKKAAAQVATLNNVDAKVGTYYKSLIDGSALEPIKRHVSAARMYHYKMTLPWSDTGPRVLSTAAYFEYMAEMQVYADEFNRLYQAFEQQYAFHRQEAMRSLGSMFNADEYPELTTLASKFGFTLQITPMPVSEDFRVDLADDEVKRLRQQIEEQTQAVMAGAVEDVYRRALKVVDAFVDRLGDADNVFKNTLVGNARELVEIMPKLNFTKDPVLDDLCQRMKDSLCQHEPDTLRHNVGARKAAHKAALEVKKDLLDFFGGAA